jgi:hypothetical protein
MRLSYERYFLIFGVLIVIGLFVSFEVAAILGVLGVIVASVWVRRSTTQCPKCGAEVRGSTAVCDRCGSEI